MVDSNNAIALMGNHEFNAICFNTRYPRSNKFLRPQTSKNIGQHKATLVQFEKDMDLYDKYIEWFKTLPVFFEDESIRAIHATWKQEIIDAFRKENQSHRFRSIKNIINTFNGSDVQKSYAELLLKGEEIKLPEGVAFFDKDNNKREHARIKWWKNPKTVYWNEYTLPTIEGLPKEPINAELKHYPENEKPVFFGHYWLKGEPELQASNVCCTDYSVAKGDRLVAYRFDGQELKNENFSYIRSKS